MTARILPLLLLAGCISRPDGLQPVEFGPEGSRRGYELYVPREVREPAPLVVALHRFTENGRIMAWMTDFQSIADREGFVVIYPDGPGRRFEFLDSEDRDDVRLVLDAIEDVAERISIDRTRVYVTGASNGGFLAHRLACLEPETFAAAAPVMALMTEELARSRGAPVPILIIHGTADRIVKPDRRDQFGGKRLRLLPIDETVAYWVQRNGAGEPVRTEMPDREADGTHTVLDQHPGAAEVRYYAVVGGGHTWPGGQERAPGFIAGPIGRDFSASEEIWAFFQRFHR
ncbi:MAG: PHB depolymerase family esterase [Planctomycetota bacterium]